MEVVRRQHIFTDQTISAYEHLHDAKQLAELGYQCCIFDNRGVGESSQPTKPLYTPFATPPLYLGARA
ncbi:hypothetical protein SeMB42_g00058 [Synchytrium endobioticum]|uniref:AB hydrolase-1 domain-containing protein n=1 Tax=Synchytrium endobioticum TaxID=286115 RepID=A0A507DUM1_9FUNG|nr:hypothetical protein SeMB42_g00058 [Synchytrium endobioticum]